ncbi:hypothetical protein XO10_07885 [Marinitoga sp. 1135]|uniref:GGDEF domain-containing protein n=1 Tax=Marinitoga sp. 1135 TaxID=1643333 RepID=UPI001585DEBB|nr:GGDEF domain-containing protein [Marinitoga sp. 1135]NUU96181.1 hypothetical protein [Marinitoga sp. 1135]
MLFSMNIIFKKLYTSTVTKTLNSITSFYNSQIPLLDVYSLKAEEMTEVILKEVLDVFINNPENFKNFFQEYKFNKFKNNPFVKDINYYIINKNGEIIETDYEPDLGLNLAKRIPSYWKFIQKKLSKTDPYISMLSFEVKTNFPRMYAYKTLDNGNIFELGILLNENSVPIFFKTISVLNFNFIQNIYTYNINYTPFSSKFPLLSKEEKNIFENSPVNTGKVNDYTIRELSNWKKAYIYFKWSPPTINNRKFNFVVLTKVVMDFSEIMTLKNLVEILFIIITFSVAIIVLIFSYRNALRVEKPITNLIKNIEDGNIGKIDDHTGVREIDTLIKYYSHITKTLAQKLSEEEREFSNLKRKLESMEKEKNLLYDMALKDTLTKLFNKKGAMNIITKIIKNQESFCVIYLEVDNYYLVKDSLGIEEANDMILNLVDIMKQTFRDRDFVFRFTDSEFVVVLRFVNLEISQRVLKRFVDAIKKFNITTDAKYKISISYGLIEYKNQNIDNLFKDAQKKMKEMKELKKSLLRKMKSSKQ